MATRVLVIDRDDSGAFFLRVDGGTLTVGDSPTSAEAVLRDLHIRAIRCEIEVEEEAVAVSDLDTSPDTSLAPQELQAGQSLHIGRSHFHLQPGETEDEEPPRSVEMSPLAASSGTNGPTAVDALRKQLVVIDGADRGRTYRLPEAGTITVGNSSKHAEIVLHDLYVSRVHCLVDVDEDTVTITHVEGKKGTLINSQQIKDPQALRLGDILRVGNSHLRLEIASADGEEAVQAVEEGEGAVGLASTDGKGNAPAEADSLHQVHPSVAHLKELQGQVLGQFRIGTLLGRGHSGLIFRAQNLKTNLVVALKVLSGDFPASGEELQGFVQALKVASGLPHANLVTYSGAGRSGPYCWIAREYIEGESIARMIQNQKSTGKFNWTAAARVAVHLGRALACLEQHKAVHGNITPHNVLVRGSDRTTKLADLMLMQALEGSKLQEAILEKKLLAELPYLAPEQAEPGAFVDQLADLYALGAVVYALLTGRPPFQGDSPEDTLAQIRGAKLVKPSALQRGIPGNFEAVVLKLLARHQENRYQTAGDLLADLEPIVGDQVA